MNSYEVEKVESEGKKIVESKGKARNSTSADHKTSQVDAKKYLKELFELDTKSETKILSVEGPSELTSATKDFKTVIDQIFSPKCDLTFSLNSSGEVLASKLSRGVFGSTKSINITKILENNPNFKHINLTDQQLKDYLTWFEGTEMYERLIKLCHIDVKNTEAEIVPYKDLDYVYKLAINMYCGSAFYDEINNFLRNKGRNCLIRSNDDYYVRSMIGFAVIINQALKIMEKKEFTFLIVTEKTFNQISLNNNSLDICYIFSDAYQKHLKWAYLKNDSNYERRKKEILKGELLFEELKKLPKNEFYSNSIRKLKQLLKIQANFNTTLKINDKHIQTFLKGLLKLEEPKNLLYRLETIFDTTNLNHIQKIIDAYTDKKPFKLSSFTSTSLFKAPSSFGPKAEVEKEYPSKAHFVIVGDQTERDVASYSDLQSENEVLISPNSRFFCSSYQKVNDQHYFVLHQMSGIEEEKVNICSL